MDSRVVLALIIPVTRPYVSWPIMGHSFLVSEEQACVSSGL